MTLNSDAGKSAQKQTPLPVASSLERMLSSGRNGLLAASLLLAQIPTGASTLYIDGVVALNVDVSSQEYDRVRSALFTTRAKLVLDTDLPGREHIETRLQEVSEPPADVQRCRPA